jgi:hypothetical protein
MMVSFSRILDIISAPLSQPKTFLTKGIGAAADKVASTRAAISSGKASGLKVIGTTLASTAVVGASVLGGAAAIRGATTAVRAVGVRTAAQKAASKAASKAAQAAKTGVKAFTPKTVKGRVIAAAAAPVVAGAVIRNPVGAVKAPVKAVSNLSELGGDLSDFAKDPSLESAKNVIKGSPVITGAVALGGAALALPTAAGLVSGALTRDAIGDVGEDIKEAVVQQPPTLQNQVNPAKLGQEPSVGVATSPVLPETQSIAKKPTQRRRRKKTPSVRNSVRVNIVNSPRFSQSKKYIKAVAYA